MINSDDIDIVEIIKSEKIITFFQPIISLKRKSAIMFEALSRGFDDKNKIIDPYTLFKAAKKQGMSLELDRVCRKKAFQAFKQNEDIFKNSLLSMNIDTRTLTSDTVGSGFIINLSESMGIDPSKVVIEIVESSIDNPSLLENFVRKYRNYGFLIAMDDLGSGFSNLNRIIDIQPNIIKLDMDLIRGISKDFYKQEIVKSVIRLAHSTGALAISEGVENIEDAVCLIDSGSDMHQGYLFAKPSMPGDIRMNEISHTIDLVIEHFKTERNEIFSRKKSTVEYYNRILEVFTGKLSPAGIMDFDNILFELNNRFHEIECSYIIDENGIQISDTVSKNNNSCNILFRSDSKGDDQSFKDYYFYIKAGQKFFVSNPYISVATGHICITISTRFTNYNGSICILCVDIKS